MVTNPLHIAYRFGKEETTFNSESVHVIKEFINSLMYFVQFPQNSRPAKPAAAPQEQSERG